MGQVFLDVTDCYPRRREGCILICYRDVGNWRSHSRSKVILAQCVSLVLQHKNGSQIRQTDRLPS